MNVTRLAAFGKYTALAAYVVFALFPLYWLIKIAVTPDRLIFTEGTALWPGAATLDNFRTVLSSDFLTYFNNSLLVSLGTAAATTLVAAGAGYAFSRLASAPNRR